MKVHLVVDIELASVEQVLYTAGEASVPKKKVRFPRPRPRSLVQE